MTGSQETPLDTLLAISTWKKMVNDAQKKYPTIEKELQACHLACRFFECIINGCTVIIHSDTTHTSQRVIRQPLELDQDFRVKIVHIDGPENGAADGFFNKTFRDIFNI